MNDEYAQTSVGARDRYRRREAEGMAVGDRDIEPGPGPQTEAVGRGRAGQRLRHGSQNPLSAPHQQQVEITCAVVISSDRDWFRAGGSLLAVQGMSPGPSSFHCLSEPRPIRPDSLRVGLTVVI